MLPLPPLVFFDFDFERELRDLRLSVLESLSASAAFRPRLREERLLERLRAGFFRLFDPVLLSLSLSVSFFGFPR